MNQMKLNPIGANQNEVELPDGRTVFFSYKTPVAAHIPGEGFVKTSHKWSMTTSRHINKFVSRNGGSGAKEMPQEYFNALI